MQRQEINWTGVAFGLALSIFAAYQQLKLPPVLPILIGDYGFGHVLSGAFISIYAVMGLLLSLRLGNVMQHQGTAALLNAAFALFTVAAAIMMLWPEHGWLFLTARAMEGVAFAILAIAGPAICTANAGTRGLAIAAALIATWIPMGALIANLLAVGLVEWVGWRSLWAIGIAATAGMALWTATVRRNPTIRFGAALLRQEAAVATGAVGHRARNMALAAALFTLWGVQMFAYLTWLPDYLVEDHGFTPRTSALLYAFAMAILAIFNLVAAPILRAGMPVPLLFIIAAGVQTVFWFLLPSLSPIAAAVSGLVIYAAAAGVAPTCLFALPATIYGIEQAGSHSFGVLMTGRNLGVLGGPLLSGALVHFTGSWDVVPPVLGVLGLISIVGALVLHARLRQVSIA